MYIHTIKENESLNDIAKAYGVSPESIDMNNELCGATATVGEELLILTPTRSYTTRHGDTIERLVLRFGMRRSDIVALNPWIETDGLTAGREVALKYDERKYGMAAANGYFYGDCNLIELRRTLPYLTYVTVASAVSENGRIKQIFKDDEVLKILKSADKVPLLRIYDKSEGIEHLCGRASAEYINNIIDYAKKKDYKGIVLNAKGREDREFAEFIVELKGKMIGCDLILFTEADESTDKSLAEYSDGTILGYSKFAEVNPPDFDRGERKVYGDFACEAESAKAFIELPCFARAGDGFTSVKSAISTARRLGTAINHDENTLLSSFEHKKVGKYQFSSTKNIKATLELISEFGFMGVSFDIMRTPLPYLMMYNAMFKTARYTFNTSPEGCSREVR